MRRIFTLIPLIALITGIAPHVTAQSELPLEELGRSIYMDNCTTCHGSTGIGNGPKAAGLTPPPADLTSVAKRHGGKFPWAHVMSEIDGYDRSGDGGAMPEFGENYEGPTIPFDSGDGIMTPTPARLVALAKYLVTLQE